MYEDERDKNRNKKHYEDEEHYDEQQYEGEHILIIEIFANVNISSLLMYHQLVKRFIKLLDIILASNFCDNVPTF